MTIEDFLNVVGCRSKTNTEGLPYRCYSRVASIGFRKEGERIFYDKLSYFKKAADAGRLLLLEVGFGLKSINELNKTLERYGLEKLVDNRIKMPYEEFKKLL